jgi:hypothetical protein
MAISWEVEVSYSSIISPQSVILNSCSFLQFLGAERVTERERGDAVHHPSSIIYHPSSHLTIIIFSLAAHHIHPFPYWLALDA